MRWQTSKYNVVVRGESVGFSRYWEHKMWTQNFPTPTLNINSWKILDQSDVGWLGSFVVLPRRMFTFFILTSHCSFRKLTLPNDNPIYLQKEGSCENLVLLELFLVIQQRICPPRRRGAPCPWYPDRTNKLEEKSWNFVVEPCNRMSI